MDLTLARRLRSLRESLGLTQARFSQRLRVSQGAVSRWEKGRHAPSEQLLSKIAELAGISVAELRYGPGDTPATRAGQRVTDNSVDLSRAGNLRSEPRGNSLRSAIASPEARKDDKQNILVVDDDDELRKELKEYLEDHGFVVSAASGGQGMWQKLEAVDYDLVIMDLIMPGVDGVALTQQIRHRSTVPIIMLTAKGETLDRVVGLEVGADDYISKPFELRELLARVRAILRRVEEPVVRSEAAPSRTQVKFDKWRFDLDSRELTSSDGLEFGLTTAEFKILEAFVTHPKRVLDRDTLMNMVYGRDWSAYDRGIDSLVVRLRRKIEIDPARPKVIKSVRGAGYLFAPNVERG